MRQRDSQDVEELRGAIRSAHHRIRCIRTDMDNERLYTENRERLEATIADAQRELAALIDRHENGQRHIDMLHDQIADMQRRVKRIEQREKIERMVKLAEEINAEGGSIHDG